MDGGEQKTLGRKKRGKRLQAHVVTLGVIFKSLCYGCGFHFAGLEISLSRLKSKKPGSGLRRIMDTG